MAREKLAQKEKTALLFALIILCITAMGTLIRLQYLQRTSFVLNDGGMFYVMIRDLQQNHFVLPQFTSYNFGHIPFAYPPLSFYEAALLHQYLRIDLIALLRWYPFLFNVLSIPAFFLLAREIAKNDRQALLATAFYSLLIPGYEWLISGGGLTRSPAHTFFILALFFFLRYLRTRQGKDFVISMVIAAVMALHHIEYAWVLGLSMVIFTVRRVTLTEAVRLGLLYLAGFALLTSPYWVTILAYHGVGPFLAAFSTGDFSLVTSIGRIVLMVFTHEPLINFVNVLAILGLLFALLTGDYRVVIWLAAIIFLDPRSAERVLVFPVTLLAAFSLDRVLLPGLSRLMGDAAGQDKATSTRLKKATAIFIAFSVLYPFLLAFLASPQEHPALLGLTDNERKSMDWVKQNTPEGCRFVVLASSASWSVDRVAEWFPALAERQNLTTVQGTEWLPASIYKKTVQDNLDFRACNNRDDNCLPGWLNSNSDRYEYVFAAGKEYQDALTGLLATGGGFTKVYEDQEITIARKK